MHEVRFARPAPVDRGLAGAGPLGDRRDQQPGIAGFGEQLDRGAQHRTVDAWVTGSAKINNHYETQSNISRRDRRRSLKRPGRAAIRHRGPADPRHDGRDGPPVPVGCRRAARPGQRRHRPARFRSGRLPRTVRRLPRRATRDRRPARRRGGQLLRATAAVAQEPALADRPAVPAPRDRRHRPAAAGGDRRAAPHRHHPPAQPAGGGAHLPHHAVLGKQRAVSAAGEAGVEPDPRRARMDVAVRWSTP